MKFNKWSIALSALGVISASTVVRAEEPKLSQVQTALSSTVLSGYISTSASVNFSRDGALPGRQFDGADKQDGFNLDVVKLALEKALTEDQWSAGYKAELLFGSDSSFYKNSANGNSAALGDSGFAIKNAYASLRAPVGNGLDFKMGVFDTVLGYEVFDAGSNPNFSRSYGFILEPTHHTGLLASYKINDMLSFSGGVANTYNSSINGRTPGKTTAQDEGQLAYLGSATITLPESTGPLAGSALYAGFTIGKSGTPAAYQDKNTQSYYAGATINTGLTGLTAGLAYDYRANGANVANPGNNYAWSGAGYLSYAVTEKFKVNGRFDYTQGSDGTYFDAPASNQQNKLYSVTGTADYSLWANVITRAEVRWDHASNSKPFGDTAAGGEKNAVTLAANVIYKF